LRCLAIGKRRRVSLIMTFRCRKFRETFTKTRIETAKFDCNWPGGIKMRNDYPWTNVKLSDEKIVGNLDSLKVGVISISRQRVFNMHTAWRLRWTGKHWFEDWEERIDKLKLKDCTK